MPKPAIEKLFEFIHSASKLSAEAGVANAGLNPRLKGCYITAQKGLAVHTVFIGYNSLTGEHIVEIAG